MRIVHALSLLALAAGTVPAAGCFENRNKSIVMMNEGVRMAQQKLYDSATRNLKQAVETDPTNYLAWSNLGAVYKDQKKWEDCANAFTEASRLQPGSADFHYELANALAEGKKLDPARQQFEEAIKLNPRLFKAHYVLGAILQTQEKLREADAEYRKAIEVNPRFAPPFLKLGYLYLDHDYVAESLAVFKAGVGVNDSDGELHLGYGRALQANKNYDQAIKEMELALKRNGELFDAVYDIGITYKLKDDRKQAKEWLQRFMSSAGSKGSMDMIKAASDAIYQLDAP